MGRYIVSFAMLAAIGTVLFSWFREATAAQVIGDAAFNGFLGAGFGLAVGWVARVFIREIDIPSNEEETDAQRLEEESRRGKTWFPSERDRSRERDEAKRVGADVRANVAREPRRSPAKPADTETSDTSTPESEKVEA